MRAAACRAVVVAGVAVSGRVYAAVAFPRCTGTDAPVVRLGSESGTKRPTDRTGERTPVQRPSKTASVGACEGSSSGTLQTVSAPFVSLSAVQPGQTNI